jgi:hypothetical protein
MVGRRPTVPAKERRAVFNSSRPIIVLILFSYE